MSATPKFKTLQRAARRPGNRSLGAFTRCSPFTRAFNHIQAKPIPTAPRVYTQAYLQPLLAVAGGGRTHLHAGGALKGLPCLILGGGWRAWRAFLHPVVQAWGSWADLDAVCYGCGGECAVSQVWPRSGCAPPPFVAFGLPCSRMSLETGFFGGSPLLCPDSLI